MTSAYFLTIIFSCISTQISGGLSASSRRRLEDSTDPNSESELLYHQSRAWNVTRTFGQITAVAINGRNNVVVFHRGSHVWDDKAFTGDVYAGDQNSPIPEATVIIMDPVTGSELGKWGERMFFLPHGLTIDNEDNYWITDVAMHQIFKFGPNGGQEPLLQIGDRFKPGDRNTQFCKPTSVAVHSQTKAVFVADGYCNSRLVQFSPTGEYVRQWGQTGTSSYLRSPFNFIVPHKVVLVEEHDEACISDRENGKIKCLNINSKNDELTANIGKKPEWSRLFSISYARCSPVAMFFAVTGPSFSPSEPEQPVMAFVVSYSEHTVMTQMAPVDARKKIPTFRNPHDIVSSKDCKNVYVVEIGPNVIWKFMTSFYGQIPDTSVSLASKNTASGTSDVAESSFSRSFTFMISALTLVVIVIIVLVRRSKVSRYGFNVNFLRRGMANSGDSFDLGRLLEDPEKSGFNRVSTHEIDADDADLSDSEVEEFNVSNVRNGLKV